MIWISDNCGLNRAVMVELLKKCLDTRNILNMEITGHANKFNKGHEQLKRVQVIWSEQMEGENCHYLRWRHISIASLKGRRLEALFWTCSF